eukprot:2308367-Pleurochrysis_carterae.AAC.3
MRSVDVSVVSDVLDPVLTRVHRSCRAMSQRHPNSMRLEGISRQLQLRSVQHRLSGGVVRCFSQVLAAIEESLSTADLAIIRRGASCQPSVCSAALLVS